MYLLYFGEHLHPIYASNIMLISRQLQRKNQEKGVDCMNFSKNFFCQETIQRYCKQSLFKMQTRLSCNTIEPELQCN